jgi:hypothetical protein
MANTIKPVYYEYQGEPVTGLNESGEIRLKIKIHVQYK